MSSKKYNTFHEIFDRVDKAKTKKDKIAVLHEYSGASLKTILGYTYDPGVKWLLPETNPPYKPLPEHSDQEARLVSELKKMYLFVEGPTDTQRNLKSTKREMLFIELLEVIDPRDALVVLGMKNGKLPYKGLTRNLVAEAFPKMSANW
jgi:hypothetical protein